MRKENVFFSDDSDRIAPMGQLAFAGLLSVLEFIMWLGSTPLLPAAAWLVTLATIVPLLSIGVCAGEVPVTPLPGAYLLWMMAVAVFDLFVFLRTRQA